MFLVTSVDVPDLDKPEDWIIQLLMSTWGASHSDSNAERLRVFKEAASKYAEPWRSAASWLPEDKYIPDDYIRYWDEPVAWPSWNGKVTLAGDAAHPMMPFRAQGLNNALQDAHNYVNSLTDVLDGKKNLSDAITEYGAEALERGAAEIKLSSAWGPALHDWNTMMNTPMMKQGYGKKEESGKNDSGVADDPAVTNNTQVVGESEAGHVGLFKDSKSHINDNMVRRNSFIADEEFPARAEEPPTSTEIAANGSSLSLLSKSRTTNISDTPASVTTNQNGLPTPTDDSLEDPLANPDRVKTMKSTFYEEELARLREEMEILKKRNSLLEERLKAVASLVMITV
jgi:hypothetical protein